MTLMTPIAPLRFRIPNRHEPGQSFLLQPLGALLAEKLGLLAWWRPERV
jgi:hypothetical protein